MMRIGGSMAGKLRSEDSFSLKGAHPPGKADATIPTHPLFQGPDHPKAKKPTISIILCTRNRPAALRECLQYVSELSPSADEVLVVDNSSGDQKVERLAKEFGARYVLEPIPGLSRARNTGLAESRCDIAAFLDDDCIPDRQWLEYLLLPFSDPQVAAAAGEVIRYAEGSSRFSVIRNASEQVRYVNRDTHRWFEIASFGGIGSGGNMAFRKSACSDVALFDERLGRGAPFRIAEENCAFVTLLSRGNAVVRIPDACVHHPAKQKDAQLEAATAVAYWIFLFTKFPENRFDLMHFLVRRLFRRRVAWRLNSQNRGSMVYSGWNVKLKAIIAGVRLYLRAKKAGQEEKGKVGATALRLISHRPVQSNSAVAP